MKLQSPDLQFAHPPHVQHESVVADFPMDQL